MRILHLSYASLICAQLTLIVVFRQMQSLEYGSLVLNLHVSCGLLALVMVLARMACAPFQRIPKPPVQSPAWQTWAARIVHLSLLGLVATMPLLGWAIVSARGGEANFLGVVALPGLVAPDPVLADGLLIWHGAGAGALLALLGVHIGAVIFNAVVRRQDVLSRMAPPPATGVFRNRVPLWIQVIVAAGVAPTLGAAIGLTELSRNTDRAAATQVEYDQAVQALRHGYTAQADIKQLYGRAAGGAPATAEGAKATGDLARDATEELETVAAVTTSAEVRSTATALARNAAGWAQVAPTAAQLQAADAAIDEAIGALSAQAFAAKTEIAHQANTSHDLLVLSLGPALGLGVITALAIALNIRRLLLRIQALASDMARGATPSDQKVVGSGEVARLMRELLITQDLLTTQARDNAALHAASRHETETLHRFVDRVAAVAEAGRQGDFSQRAPTEPALGDLAGVGAEINALCDAVQGFLTEIDAVAVALARGDLTARMTESSHGQFGRVASNLNLSNRQLAAMIFQVRTATETTHQTARQLDGATQMLADHMEGQARDLRDLAIAVGEINAGAQSAAANAAVTSKTARSAARQAREGQVVSGRASDAMGRIKSGSSDVVAITQIIDEIAFNTRMLGLNAAIEAARAGEAGKGFAVVAGEVGVLAHRSGEEAKAIKALIATSHAELDAGAGLVDDASEALTRIVADAEQIGDLAAEISDSARNQADQIAQVDGSIRHMDQVIQGNWRTVRMTSTTSRWLADEADKLDQLIAVFKIGEGAAETPAEAAADPAARPSPPLARQSASRWSPRHRGASPAGSRSTARG